MSHDRFCYLNESSDIAWPSGGLCVCPALAQVRADEREQAADRVQAVMDANYYGQPCGRGYESVIAAVRGDGEQA